MPSSRKRPPHPLLLEQGYWRNRLQALKLTRPSALYTPRPDLSSRSVEIEEFRIRAHDGLRLCGLRGKRRVKIGHSRVRLRLVQSDESPAIDLASVRANVVEYALQFPAGRILVDRVLDVVRICQLAASREGVEPGDVQLYAEVEGQEPDEFLIASQLFARENQGQHR